MSAEFDSGWQTELLERTRAWCTWAPRQEIEPDFEIDDRGGPDEKPALVVRANGNPIICGCWRLRLPELRAGRRYEIEAAYQTEGIPVPRLSVWAVLAAWQGRREQAYDFLDPKGSEEGWQRVGVVFEPDEKYEAFDLCLYMSWTPKGFVRWSDVRLADVTARPSLTRTARLAAISGRPSKPTCAHDCIDFYCERIDEVGADGVDLVCLPEVINADGLPGTKSELAEPIPGPSSEQLADAARTHQTYVGASLRERDGDAIYNTGILIDRKGNLVGKYHKTHLPLGEGFPQGTAPGYSYPILKTNFGKVGFMICYDAHFPEVARVLSLEGADVILHCNMGDGREGGNLWESLVRVRALDNQVHLVAAVNGGRSCIVSPRGEILSITDHTLGAIAYASCDLDISVRNYTKREIRKRYNYVRRPDTYGALVRT